jgi:hypothetical protein
MVDVTVLPLFLLAAALSPALETWKAEIEAKGGAPVLVAKVEFDQQRNELSLAPGTPRAELFEQYLNQAEFAKQFSLMYAVMVFNKQPGAEAYLILENGARQRDWQGEEEALLAHEFGHAWIRAQGFPTPMFVNNKWACVSIHAGDITQHVIIRQELEKRGIDAQKFWIRSLEAALPEMENGTPLPESDRCARVRQTAQLVDVRLGMPEGAWPNQARYEAAVRKAYPEVQETAAQIVAYLRQHDMADKDQHREALKFVFERLKDLAYQRTSDYRVENKTLRPIFLAR